MKVFWVQTPLSLSLPENQIIEGLTLVWGAKGGTDEERDAGVESKKEREREREREMRERGKPRPHVWLTLPSSPLLYNSSSVTLSFSLSLPLCQRGQIELMFPENTTYLFIALLKYCSKKKQKKTILLFAVSQTTHADIVFDVPAKVNSDRLWGGSLPSKYMCVWHMLHTAW